MLILYAYDTNTIFVEPIKSISDTDILYAYDVLYDTLETAGHVPTLNIMGNEVSTALTWLMQKRKTVVQLAPLHIHRQNTDKLSIFTFNCFCGWSSVGGQ